MSKGLKALKKLQRGDYGTREHFDKQLSIIEKELKALMILSRICRLNLSILNLLLHEYMITQEEFDLLKVVLLLNDR